MGRCEFVHSTHWDLKAQLQSAESVCTHCKHDSEGEEDELEEEQADDVGAVRHKAPLAGVEPKQAYSHRPQLRETNVRLMCSSINQTCGTEQTVCAAQ